MTLLADSRFRVVGLLTTMTEGYRRVTMSGVREELLDRQAEELGLPLTKVWVPPGCPNQLYEARMATGPSEAAAEDVRHLAFSDLFLEDVRSYRERWLAGLGWAGVFPLFGRETSALAREMIAWGLRATLVCLDPELMPPDLAGREFDLALLASLPPSVDPCGERGEFHTFVHSAPIFRRSIPCRRGEVVRRDGFVYCDLEGD
ncbi:MAG: ATP-binding protein, partial [Candidatus Dormibacteria bacterium]